MRTLTPASGEGKVLAEGVDLLGTILKGVSRSFYLSLKVLPKSLRRPMGLAYLFCRAADTIADTPLIGRAERLTYLELFRQWVQQGKDRDQICHLQEALTGRQTIPAERELLSRLDQCLGILEGLERGDQERIRRLVLTLTQGMEMDLRTFPGEDEGRLVALEDRSELDRYTYYVAGCVGEFWTDMHLAHRPSLAHWNGEEMRKRAVRFGKGLQLTNILRDLAKDLRIGRCYLPRQELEALGVGPRELLDPQGVGPIRPLIEELLALTLAHYREGWTYTLMIPRREIRMRLACAWPLLIGLKTLTLVQRAPNLLDPATTVKIGRWCLYRLLLGSTALACSNWGLDRYFGHLRHGLTPGGASGLTSPHSPC